MKQCSKYEIREVSSVSTPRAPLEKPSGLRGKNQCRKAYYGKLCSI